MRLLVITGYGKRLSVEGKVFKIEDRNKSSSKVNPADIESIVIESSGVSITSAAIELASMAGIPIFIIRGRGSPTVISPIYSVKTAETRRKQYSATTGKSGCTLAKSLVRSKISNQAECLRNLNRYFNDEDVRKEVEKLRENSKRAQELQCSENWSSQLRQIESSAARAYWGSLAVFLPESIGFDGRDVDSGDAFNCSLNYIYALLYSECFKKLSIAGLDPYGGIYHVDKAGRMSLVYDFSDPVKPFLDYSLTKERQLLLNIKVSDGVLDEDARKNIILLYDGARKSKVRIYDKTSVTFQEALTSFAFNLAESFRKSEEARMDMSMKW
ncbi:CRISPR-associated endonuclease Cas1 [Fervidicoccus fontis]|uniref:CRISPR-associated endonuclease Cas1 n=1 Tax=Fervidicoccus fontis (strain DSM 19380 / JCM 18336 / VKM B-2539 / Kam940) TaxID=1163730 RepID=H9ZZA4_FERFK|nr:CRISPR-associated endonuclease Cas1 [Fervidicoccus fontis]AFH42061.1 CRISPR-associated protein Cas1 [Fervidicoccus fontis Kam940]